MDKVDRFYEIYSILSDSGDKVTDHETEYLEIIQAVKSNRNEKGLACQFIPKFLKHFPHLSKTALEVQLDLAEDDDVAVRKLAVKHLPGFCKVSKQLVPKIADILTQMLQSEDSTELSTVHAALMTVMEVDIKGTLQGILLQISTGEEDIIRKRAIELLNAKLKILPEDLITKEVEEFFLESCKKIIPKVSGQDFLCLLSLLSHLKIAKTVPVQNTIVDIIATQIDVDVEFDVSSDSISGFMNFLNQACPFFSPFVSSKKFVLYICLKIFPKTDEIGNLENGHELILDIFKVLAEISVFVQNNDKVKECAEILFNELLKYVPLPPDSEEEKELGAVDPSLHFTHIECLLFTFLQFLKHDDTFLTSTANVARNREMKLRLQFLSRVIMRGLKQIQNSKKTVKIGKTENEELKLKVIAERTMNNLNTLIKDFFRYPPSIKTAIFFSWKTTAPTHSDLRLKRRSEGSSSSDNFIKRERRGYREIYVPPGGKYSSRISFSSAKESSTNDKEKGD